jgi:hypothetical protein
MATFKKAKGGGSGGEPALNSKLRRHYKEKARREKLLRQKPPGVKERFVSGCFALGITGAIIFIVALIWTWIRHGGD